MRYDYRVPWRHIVIVVAIEKSKAANMNPSSSPGSFTMWILVNRRVNTTRAARAVNVIVTPTTAEPDVWPDNPAAMLPI